MKQKTELQIAIEGLMKRGAFDERDLDYLEHVDVPNYDAIAMEGIIKAKIHEVGSDVNDVFTESKGWFLGIESKRKYIGEICDDLIDWLKDKEAEEPNLDLDMGAFKTWMKTSETLFFRYSFLLHDASWNKIESDLKSGKITKLESLYDIDFNPRKESASDLDSITSIKGLKKIVEEYAKRSDIFFNLIIKRKIRIKLFPFQIILLGAADLRRTVKKIVNLAT